MKGRRFLCQAVFAVLILFSLSMPVLAANVIMVPEVIYTGETAELKVSPEDNWFLPAGASMINVQYKKYFKMLRRDGHFRAIKALKKGSYTKIIKGAVQPANVLKAFIFRCKAPYFKATFRGKNYEKDEVFIASVGDDLKVELVCNHQDDIKWSVSQDNHVKIVSKDKKSVTLRGVTEGRATLTAKYMGYQYDVLINVKPVGSSLLNRFGELLKGISGLTN